MPEAGRLEDEISQRFVERTEKLVSPRPTIGTSKVPIKSMGADLRITNFGGGNTSSKFELPDPIYRQTHARPGGERKRRGSRDQLTAEASQFLYLEKLDKLISRYRGEEHEDEMVEMYSLCAFGTNRVAASIDTPLHAFCRLIMSTTFIPIGPSLSQRAQMESRKLREFNKRYGRDLIWVPWQRPGFEIAMMLRRAVEEVARCEGIILGSHGLFTWGQTQRECYGNSCEPSINWENSSRPHSTSCAAAVRRGGGKSPQLIATSVAAAILPFLRGPVSSNRRLIGHYESSEDVMEFANSRWAQELSALGTSCPDHFLRTRICPMYVPWDPQKEGSPELRIESANASQSIARITRLTINLRPAGFSASTRYKSFVVVIPALGVFGFAKDKREARITTEFFHQCDSCDGRRQCT